MSLVLIEHWWTLTLRGLLAILFGIVALLWPPAATFAIVFLFAAFAVVEGIFALVASFGWGLPARERILLIVTGILGLAVGAGAVLVPGLLAVVLVLIVAWWAILTGILQIIVAIEFRKLVPNDWLLALGGVLAIVFGVLLIWRPLAGILTLGLLFGFYALLAGFIMTALGLRMRRLAL